MTDHGMLLDVMFTDEGKQNIVCLDGMTLVYAHPQQYFFQVCTLQDGEESVTIDKVTIAALTTVEEGMAKVREYLECRNVPVDKAVVDLDMPELLFGLIECDS